MTDKGTRNERKAAQRAQNLFPCKVHNTAGGRYDNDAWNVADLILIFNDTCKCGDWPFYTRGDVVLVQVKTNGFNGKQAWQDQVDELKHDFPENVLFEMWTRYDGQGGEHGYPAAWRHALYRFDGWWEYHDGRCEEQIGR